MEVRVADLDKLSSKKFSFKLHGVDHKIDPPSIGNWLEIVDSSNALIGLKDQDGITKDQVVDAYFSFLSKMCPDLTKEDILKAKQDQLAALWQIAMDMMNGYEEKKTLMSLMLLSLDKEEVKRMITILNRLLLMPQESLQKYAESLAGQ